ncbi:hypothetical protein P168DRAFT_316230 [Aspergillus campestris IBT 28561]|uniref:Uncharacterized protein n=1 Tax=Aspergillus campestris (strain IBT 28561) TaxID=1392248 RepID=A0A2I1D8L9_ASPC2|nr:uncharacterized protein P168DRAFT_316230 [Aspergillus campestris IBT 28561]PKY06209.1 hypothetical protein P168DRAFT_316230 [Aspergillus campestris IBT 28561]
MSPHGPSPPPGLRHRGPVRAATVAHLEPSQAQRRNSILSDTVSDARRSLRSSTDDLFLPRAPARSERVATPDESHWQSFPLGLALLPAVAGLFFKDGSAIVTDVTLLVIAAIFLNWSVRLPWDWYRSAQATLQQRQDKYYDVAEVPPDVDGHDTTDKTGGDDAHSSSVDKDKRRQRSSDAAAARKELMRHELAALVMCFVFPIVGTLLLHTIRSQLSRPSEGLVSNYNLTIFLLASEIRPASHLLKMVQARTLHLQRIVLDSDEFDDPDSERIDAHKILDLTKRLEELEAHVAETAAQRLRSTAEGADHADTPLDMEKLVTQASVEVRKTIQPDIDALNRAVRRYEKRTAISGYQTDGRLQAVERHVNDAVSLAAAAHRQPRGFFHVVFDSLCAAVLVPVQFFLSLASLPARLVRRVSGLLSFPTRLGKRPPGNKGKRKASPAQGSQVNSSSRSPSSSRRTRRDRSTQEGDVEGKALKPIREND